MNTEERLQKIEELLNLLISTDRYTFQKNIQIFDGRNIQLGKGTGTKIGTEVTQKMAFYGETPVVQASAITDPAGGTTIDTQARTAINAIIVALENIGIIST